MKPYPGRSAVQGMGTRQPSRPFRAPPEREEDGVLAQVVRELDLGQAELLPGVEECRAGQREEQQRGGASGGGRRSAWAHA